jgi:hypothetical protein
MQHVHNILLELSQRTSFNFGSTSQIFAYGALVGEPALGPVATMYRPSSSYNPWKPLGATDQESTHDSHGVITLGFRKASWQLEASRFRVRSAGDDSRLLDLGALDSWSTRITALPDKNWNIQVSHGRLVSNGSSNPNSLDRTTASLLHVSAWRDATGSSQVVWSRQSGEAGSPTPRYAFGAESQVDTPTGDHVYGRCEWLEPRPNTGESGSVILGVMTLGYVRDLGVLSGWLTGLGVDLTVATPGTDDPASRATGLRIFLQANPPPM